MLEHVLKPAAFVLSDLQARGVTHRAICPANLFQASPGVAVTFGCAWAAPPACYQPAWIEPPYSAVCVASGRGDGTVADDIYALGAMLIMLALGRNPAEDVPDDVVVRRKLDLGSYAALAGNERLPASIAELARGMLADDPDHRPSPALLATPAAARARRIAARPIRRAQRPIDVGAHSAATARTLAFALQHEPLQGLAALRNGIVDRWLRRGLGDAVAAGRIDELVRLRDAQVAGGDNKADPVLLANAIAVLDPAAPLVWRGVVLWPDGLGPALDHALHHEPDQAASLTEIVIENVAEAWAARQESGRHKAACHVEVRDLAALRRGRTSVVPLRLCYSLNPLTPCESPLFKGLWVTRIGDVLPAIEEVAGSPSNHTLVDTHLAAFVAARRDERMHADIGTLAAGLPPGDVMAELHLLARLQAKLHPEPLPKLCSWAAAVLQAQIGLFSSKARRTRLAGELAVLTVVGDLPRMAALLDDKAAWAADLQERDTALARVAEIDQTLADLTVSSERRIRQAQRVGQDAAGAISTAALVLALAAAVFA